MKINFILRNASLNGGTRVVAVYADLLRSKGHEVRVISRRPRQYTARARLRALARGRILPKTRPHRPTHLDGLDLDWRIAQHSKPLTEQDIPEADVTIATWWETAEWVHALPPSRGEKIYFCQGYEAHEGQPVDRVNATYRLPLRQICVSSWVRDMVREQAGHDRQIVVPNAVDIEAFATPEREKTGLPTIGFMYNSAYYKAVDVVLEALRLARADHPELRAICFSARPPVDRLPVPEWIEVEINPAQRRIAEIYASCDAWLFGSRREGFGLPILEAMASRTPVIATPAGAAPELLEGGGGILVPHDNARSMAEAIGTIATMDSPDWKALSDRAFARTRAMSWADAADRFEAALVEAVCSAEEQIDDGHAERAAAAPPAPTGARK